MNNEKQICLSRRRHYDDNFIMRHDQSLAGESTRDSLESSEISSDAFSSRFKPNYNNFNHITQHIQNNNNKITIIIKHNDGPTVQPDLTPQVIYIQPATASQPNLSANQSDYDLQVSEIYNSLDDLDSEEHYQFYGERAIDVPDNFKRNSYLVLNFNDAANRKLKRRICTPTRNLIQLEDLTYPHPHLTHKAIDKQVSLFCANSYRHRHNGKSSEKPMKQLIAS